MVRPYSTVGRVVSTTPSETLPTPVGRAGAGGVVAGGRVDNVPRGAGANVVDVVEVVDEGGGRAERTVGGANRGWTPDAQDVAVRARTRAI
jgi:hypothetical protein